MTETSKGSEHQPRWSSHGTALLPFADKRQTFVAMLPTSARLERSMFGHLSATLCGNQAYPLGKLQQREYTGFFNGSSPAVHLLLAIGYLDGEKEGLKGKS